MIAFSTYPEFVAWNKNYDCKKGGNMTDKYYVISSSEFDGLAEALEKMEQWREEDNLDVDAKIYEVKRVYKIRLEAEEVEE